jgi:hypothetical protein
MMAEEIPMRFLKVAEYNKKRFRRQMQPNAAPAAADGYLTVQS